MNFKKELLFFESSRNSYKEKYRFDVGLFLKACIETSPKSSITYKDVSILLTDLQKQINTIRVLCVAHNLSKQDRVIIFVSNSLAFYGVFYAVLQSGAIAVPVNTFLSDAECEQVIRDARPRIIITLHQEKQRFSSLFSDIAVLSFDEMLQDIESSDSMDLVTRGENDPAVILYTSGTTGVPKGVVLSSKNILTNMFQAYTRIFSTFDEKQPVLIAALPLFHSFSQNTCVFTALYCGAHLVVLPKIERQLLIDAIKKYQPTVFLGVPALFGLLCLLKYVPLDSVEIFISGGDALPHKIRQAFALIYNRKICNGYGLSEASPVVATDLSDTINEVGCIGQIIPGMDYEIRDEQGNVLSDGAIGNLHVRGDNVMLGYYNDAALTERVLKNGWLDTGDRAYVNKNGAIIVVGREKELIKHKGINIYPQEIENVILMDAAVIRVGVVGERAQENGEEYPVAYVQIRSEYAENKEGIQNRLLALCKERLAAYKVPKKCICTTQTLPTTVTGKVDKKVLAQVIKS